MSLSLAPAAAEAQSSPGDPDLCSNAPAGDASAKLFTRWIGEVWHQGRLDLVPKLVGAEYIRHEGAETRTVTPMEYAEEIAAIRRRLPDVRFVIHDCDLVGDRLWTRWSMVSTSNESGQAVNRMGFQAYRVSGGRLVETWSLILPTNTTWDDQRTTPPLTSARAPAAPVYQDEEKRVLAAEDEYVAAEIRRDETALRRLVDDRFAYNTSRGTSIGKEELIKRVLAMNMADQTIAERSVLLEGNIALIFGTAELKFASPGKPETVSILRYTSTFINRDGQWRMLALQMQERASNSTVSSP